MSKPIVMNLIDRGRSHGLVNAASIYAEPSDPALPLLEALFRFGTTRKHLADALFLPEVRLNRTGLTTIPDISKWLADALSVLDRAAVLAGTNDEVIDWYCYEPIPGFGNVTAARLVLDGRSAAVIEYLDALAAGVFA